MTVTRNWYPDDFIDEDLPTGLHSAQAWADECGPGSLGLLEESERARFQTLLVPGNTIAFKWCENRGTVTVSIGVDGIIGPAARCAETPDLFGEDLPRTPPRMGVIAPEVNNYWSVEEDIFAETLDDFAGIYAEKALLAEDEVHQVDVDLAVWSDKILYRVGADGLTLTEITEPKGQTPC